MLQHEAPSVVSMYLMFSEVCVEGAQRPLLVIPRKHPHVKPGPCPLTHMDLEYKLSNPVG